MATVIYQGDQYLVPFRVKRGGVVLTPENIDAIRISLGGHVQQYPDGNLTFDGNEFWMFALRSDMSKTMNGKTPYQIEYKKGDVKQHSDVLYVDISGSLPNLKEDW